MDSRQATRTEKFHYHNSLTALVKGVENSYTTIDLRNDSCVSGRVISVDGYMNLELKNAVYYDPRGREHYFDNFFVQNRNVRYVHMPRGTTCREILDTQINGLQNPNWHRDDTSGSQKNRRAKQYNEQTKRDIAIKK
ncbi:unnamed protein product [Brassicogethes aeneus]|uniref:Sm domain-containing protein n=1 Tax=Brassicogethes aeneus TaxID=1431903 RepID=A0A9P0AZ08_BRAAE|nr:unnamed protein product [Brassicogethes aeneus]